MHSDDLADAQAQRAAAEARTIGGEPDEDHVDPAQRPVREAGGGEAEGFEEAERALIEHAEHGDLGHSPRNDAYSPESESDLAPATYGEADHVQVSERQAMREDAAPRRPNERGDAPPG